MKVKTGIVVPRLVDLLDEAVALLRELALTDYCAHTRTRTFFDKVARAKRPKPAKSVSAPKR